MTGTTAWTTTARAAALAALVLALLVRLAVPAGWMPRPAGGFGITLCTGSGPVQVWMDVDGDIHKVPTDKAPNVDHPCVLAALSAPLLPIAAAILAVPTLVALVVPPLGLAETAIGRGLAAPPPPSTGPPSHL